MREGIRWVYERVFVRIFRWRCLLPAALQTRVLWRIFMQYFIHYERKKNAIRSRFFECINESIERESTGKLESLVTKGIRKIIESNLMQFCYILYAVG